MKISQIFLIILFIFLYGCGKAVTGQTEAHPEGLTVTQADAIISDAGQSSAVQVLPANIVVNKDAGPLIEKAVVEPKAMPQAVSDSFDKVDIQRALKNAGYYNGALDGKIGPKSKWAIKEFQRANNLSDDGKVGPKTWAVLKAYLNRPADE